MTNNLTTIAALPKAGGCMSSLPAERNEAKIQMKAEYFQEPDELEFPPIDGIEDLAQKYLAACQGTGC